MIYLDNLVDTQPRKLNTMCKRMHLDVKASSTRLPPYTHRLVHALREDRRQGRSPLNNRKQIKIRVNTDAKSQYLSLKSYPDS